jgi:hypothetical protein
MGVACSKHESDENYVLYKIVFSKPEGKRLVRNLRVDGNIT